MDGPAKMKVMEAYDGGKQADSLKIANAIRPAIESRLDQLRDDKERRLCCIDGTKATGDDVSRPEHNYEILKVYVVNLTAGVMNAKVAVLYLSCVYGFWSSSEIKRRGRKGEIKAGRDWAVLEGSNLRKLAAYVITALNRTPYARSEEMMVLKALHQRINRTVVPERPNRRSSKSAIAIEGAGEESQTSTSSSATSASDSTIELLDSDDDDLEASGEDVASSNEREMPAHGNTADEPTLQLCTI
ncbi:unnamed protein product [Symbiodinium sp. CCMP2592]|nr:unnamed protein product [Symbiodinium sp. CCMP2592]